MSEIIDGLNLLITCLGTQLAPQSTRNPQLVRVCSSIDQMNDIVQGIPSNAVLVSTVLVSILGFPQNFEKFVQLFVS